MGILAAAVFSVTAANLGHAARVPVRSGYRPANVQAVWDNHFSAFAAFDVEKIMQDYDSTSRISVFNDNCVGGEKREGYSEFEGEEQIEAFFSDLFSQLGKDLNNIDAVGPKASAPVVKNSHGPYGNVFLTWRTKGLRGENVIDYATDTFSFRSVHGEYKIRKQNIVVTEPNKPCQSGGSMLPTDGKDGIYAAWNNHFSAFGEFNENKIMEDYLESSIVQVYDNTLGKYEEFKGLRGIRRMFHNLFANLRAKQDSNGDLGITVPLVQVEPDSLSVLLVWSANAFPKATDTFIFNKEHKIIRQNIVVQTA